MIAKNLKKRIFTSFFLILLFLLIFIFDFILISSLLLIGIFSILEFSKISRLIFNKKIYYSIINIIFTTYIFLFCLLFYFLSLNSHLEILLFIILVGCISSDIGGFVIGKIFKGPKLSKISPNKTISGAIGSIIFTSTTLICLIYYYTENLFLGLIFIGLLISVACQLGDLFFSFLKRKAKIKDTGSILPGHGGFLDRLDGIFLGVPVGFITFIIIF